MLSQSQFDILYCVLKAGGERLSQRKLSDLSGISLGKVNGEVAELKSAGLLDEDAGITSQGVRALAPYKVKNAVIMAAGMSTRFAPLSYEKPKALLKVKGDVLIEREIRQLQEAGITEITLVVGYMKEKMFYLADKYGVDIVINEDYYHYNNTSTLIRVLDRLDNTYICSSDDYFSENVFEPYVYRPYYAAVYTPDATDEYCLTTDRKGRITKVTIGGEASWYMLGHVYFDRAFSQKFGDILMREYAKPSTREELWENLYMKHIRELELYIRKYPAEVIHEFDSLDELRDFDSRYIVNADSAIFRNIEGVLHCKDSDITQIEPIKKGLTNTSFAFTCNDRRYVYRHPGVGTSAYINRQSEAISMEIARRLGLDDTYIYVDPEHGWKLSYFVEDARTLDYHRPEEVAQALKMIHTLHDSGETSPFRFDLFEEIEKFEKRLKESNRGDFDGMQELAAMYRQIKTFVLADNVPECISHNDCYDPNFLIGKDGKMYLIDWEYSGMADPASDLGTFIACSDYTMEEVDALLAQYLGHAPEGDDYRHYLAFAGVSAYYWFVWALYQESVGKSVGEYLYIWYRYAKQYGRKALEMYGR